MNVLLIVVFFSFVVYTGKDVLKKIKEDTNGEFRTALMNLIEVTTAQMKPHFDWTRTYITCHTRAKQP